MEQDDELYQELLETFAVELKEECDTLSCHLLDLEKADEQEQINLLLQKIFRIAHNIKGAAASVSIDSIVQAAHQLEDMFACFKTKSEKPTSEEIDSFLNIVDLMLSSFQEYSSGYGKNNEHSSPLTKETSSSSDVKPEGNASTLDKAKEEDTTFIRVKSDSIQKANVKADEIFMCHMRMQSFMNNLYEHKKTLEYRVNTFNDKMNKEQFLNAIASAHQNIDSLQNEIKDIYNSLSFQTTSLQELLRNMRLVPINLAFNNLSRVARDTAKNLGKKVDLEVVSNNLEIDKLILESLKDPLIHIIRNAIDHGIEKPNNRTAAGKSSTGNIKIIASNISGDILIEIIDDGAGVDPDVVKKRAVENGLVTKDIADELSDEEILDLIFMPGFSTKLNVTDISGRGVGMDVVRTNIEGIKGNVSLHSTIDEGTKISLKVPLTLATERGVMIESGANKYIIPSLLLKNIILVSSEKIRRVNSGEVFMMDDEPVTVFFLSEILQEGHVSDSDKEFHGIILQRGNRKIMILVDKVISEHDCVVKPLGHHFANFRLVSGGVISSKGEIVLMLNPSEIFNIAVTMGRKSRVSSNKREDVKKKVLVVDDSITTRTLEVNVLNSNGFEAHGAVNGKDAWDKVNYTKYDLIITDIDMPIMNGFEFVNNLKSDKELAKIPIIMISSNDSDEIKDRGVSAGVDLYIVKKHFDSATLLDAINRVT